MIEKTTIIKITNRDNGVVGYTIPDLNLHRNFQPGETKELPFDEIQRLYNVAGGAQLLKHFLIIHDEEAVKLLLGDVEPEYNYTDEEVKILLSPAASLAQLEDCLNFAPQGVVELVKDLAVTEELNDVRKRALILEKTGFDVTKAILVNQESRAAEEAAAANVGRKAEPIRTAASTTEASATPSRQSAPVESRYKIINKK